MRLQMGDILRIGKSELARNKRPVLFFNYRPMLAHVRNRENETISAIIDLRLESEMKSVGTGRS